MRIPVLLSAFLAVLLLGATAGAKGISKTDKEARKQFTQGVELYEKGKYELAAIAFERAYELKPSYKILFNIAQVENSMEHYAAAYTAYVRYLEEGGDKVKKKRRKLVEGEIDRLETLVGRIEIASPVDGAKVKIDNEVVGETPLPAPVLIDLGKHEVVVLDSGEEILNEIVKVAGGETVTVTVEIKEEEPPAPPEEPEPALEEEPPKRVWTWVAGGVGAAAGIAAAVTGGIASSRSSDLEKNCADGECPPGEWDTLDSTRNLATTTNVLIGVAAAGVAAGVALFFLEPRLGEEKPIVAPVVTEEGASITLTGRF